MAKMTLSWFIEPIERNENTTYMDTFQRTFDTEDLKEHLYHIKGVPYLMGTAWDDRELRPMNMSIDYYELLEKIKEAEDGEG